MQHFNIRGVSVKQTLVDRAVSYFSPQAGYERLKARAALTMLDASGPGTGGYVGGRRDRRPTRRWRPREESADAALLPDLKDLRQRSRDLARNMPIAAGAISTNVVNVVGDGLEKQPAIDAKVLKLSPAAARDWEKEAKRLFELACVTADWGRKQNFYKLQRIAHRGQLESGDVFALRRFREDPGDVFGTKIMLVEADRVSNPGRGMQDTETLIAGIEHDGQGVWQAVHVSNRHPGDRRPGTLKWSRVPVRAADGSAQVIHLYDPLRPEQTRGAPYLAPIVEALKQLSDYSEAEITAAVNAAMMFAFVKSKAPVDEDGNPIIGEKAENSGSASGGNDEVNLANGAFVNLLPEEDVVIKQPGRPNAEYGTFLEAFCQFIGTAIELPFEVLIMHFTASYSASRAALEIAWQGFNIRRINFAWDFCQAFYEWVIDEAWRRGFIDAPGFEDPMLRQAWLEGPWIGPARWTLDPSKDSAADAADVALRVKTRSQIITERIGGNFEQTAAQLAYEEETLRAGGLAQAPTAAAPGNDPQADDPARGDEERGDEEEPEDETEDEKRT